MRTKSSIYNSILREVFANEDNLSINDLYTLVSDRVIFTADDLTLTTVKGNKTKEHSWKRNLRNVLQQMKGSGQLVNSPKNYWRNPSPNPSINLDSEESWHQLKNSAQEAEKKNIIWNSPKEGHRYQVERISREKISIARLDGKGSSTITKEEVRRATIILNAAGGIVNRATLINTVAKESSIVFLHPQLEWDTNFDSIKVNGIRVMEAVGKSTKKVKPSAKQVREAINDDPEAYQTSARKVRLGQSGLRKKLLSVYDDECCISRTGPRNVLQAAHIEAHSMSGINTSENALLLRSDLHDLFDDKLLIVHPKSLKIFIHPLLKETDYYKFNGTILKARNDNKKPSRVKLQKIWDIKSW